MFGQFRTPVTLLTIIFGWLIATIGYASSLAISNANAERIAPELKLLSKLYPTQDSLQTEILYKKLDMTLGGDYLAQSNVYLAVRIQDEEAVQDYSQIHIPYNSYFNQLKLDFANVLTPAGRIQSLNADAIQLQTPQQSNYYQDRKELVFSLPSLKVGSVIEFQFSINEINPIVPNQWSDRLNFYWWQTKANGHPRIDPVREVEFNLTLPNDIELAINKSHTTPNFSRQLKSGMAHYRFKAKDFPALKPQRWVTKDYLNNLYITVATHKSWQPILDWAYNEVQPTIYANQDIKNIAKKLSQNNTTRNEKIRAVYEYMQSNIRYVFAHVGRGGYRPHNAVDVFKNAYGDCKDQTVLALTLLKEMGIPAYAALISTANGPAIDPDFPHVGFDHMIVYIPPHENNKEIWMDTTGRKALYPGYTSSIENRPALILKPNQLAQITITPDRPFQDHGAELTMDIAATDDLKIAVDFTIKVYGSYETNYRSWWNYAQDRHRALKSFTQTLYDKAEYVNARVINSDSLWEPLRIEGRVLLDTNWKGGDDTLNMAVGLNQLLRTFESLASYDQPETRQADFHINHGYELKLRANLKSPGKQFSAFSLTAGPNKTADYFRLKQSAKETEHGYQVDIQFQMPNQTIPVDKYSDFYNELLGLDQLPPWVISFYTDDKIKNTNNVAQESNDKNSKKNVTQRVDSLQSLLDSGEFSEALKLAQTLVQEYPNNGEVHYLLGLAQGYNGLFDQSNNSFTKAMELGYEL